MIGRAAGSVLDWYGSRRRRQLEAIGRDPAGVQERALRRLTATARDTEFGLAQGFRGIRSVAEYQARVPVRDYMQLRPWIERAAAGEESVAWPGRCRDWVKTSGTTAGDKVIPVTPEAFASHRKGGWDALLRAASLAGGGQSVMGGPMLFLGGSTARRPLGEGTQVGDLSGLVASRLPWAFRGRYSPGPECAAIPHWEERLDAIAAVASTQDVRLLSGMLSWLVILAGAPNLVRGHSHSGNVSAAELAARGWLDVLSSDYVPASVLHGAFLLHLQHGMTLPRAMATVSATPARRVGLEDRGAITMGRRADLVRVRVHGDVVAVRAVWCRGERVA